MPWHSRLALAVGWFMLILGLFAIIVGLVTLGALVFLMLTEAFD